MSVLSDILCGSNASPLKKLMLDKGLCKDMAMYSSKSRENTLVIEVRDIDEDKAEEIISLIDTTIRAVASEGVDREKINAILNSIEFRLRERDFGTLPTGIAFAMTVYGGWIYGAKPEDSLLYDDILANLRADMNGSYFEDMLMKITSENPHRATVLMIPDNKLGAKEAAGNKAKMAEILAGMSEDELAPIIADEAALRTWQQTEPTEEQIASLPTLTLEDIPKEI
jgi:Zn-dependent M16 (insulinase) family peptidase